MVPRADIVAVEAGTDREGLLNLLVARSHSRLPVYRETLDDVTGIVHIKDVLAVIAGGGDFSLEAIVRPVSIVAPRCAYWICCSTCAKRISTWPSSSMSSRHRWADNDRRLG